MERPGKKLRFQPNTKPGGSKSVSGQTFVAPPMMEVPEKEDLLKLVEQEESGDSLDEPTLKRIILNFDKRVLKNQELRVKFPDSPEKYLKFNIYFNIICSTASVFQIYGVRIRAS